MQRGRQHGNKSYDAHKAASKHRSENQATMWKMCIKPAFLLQVTFHLSKKQISSQHVRKKKKKKSFLAPKGWAPFFWHELLNLPVSSLVGIHATKKSSSIFTFSAQHSESMHVMAVFLRLLYNTTQAIQVLTRILLFQKAERGGEKKVDSFERETSTLLLRIYCREWAFKTKGSQWSN